MASVRALLRRVWVQHLLVVLVSAALLLPNMDLGLYDPWETHYAEVARRILVHGDWITLRWHAHSRLARDVNRRCYGDPEECYFFSKPVLIFWLMGVSLGAFGVDQEAFDRAIAEDPSAAPRLLRRNDAAARFPLTLVGLLGIFGVYYFLRQLAGPKGGFLGAFVLLTTPFYYFLSRQIMTDIAFVVPMSVGLLSLTWWLVDPKRARPRNVYLFYALCGIATLAKGLLGVVLPAAIIVVFLLVWRPEEALAPLLCWDLKLLRALRHPREFWRLWRARTAPFTSLLFDRLRVARGFLVFVAFAGPWYAAVWIINGRAWYREFIVKHHLRRMGEGVHGERGTFEYFIEQLGYGLWPWVALVPLAVGALWFGWRRRERAVDQGLRTMLLVWAVVSFGLFTVSTTKFHHYVFPAVPPLAMLVGLTLARLLDAGRIRRIEKALIAVGLGLLAVVSPLLLTEPFRWICLFIYKYDRRWPAVEGAMPWLGAALALFSLGLLMVLLGRRLLRVGVALLCVGAMLAAAWGIHGLMVDMVHVLSQRDCWEAYHERRQPGDRVYQWSMRWRGEVWYSFDEAIEIPQRSSTKLRQELSRPGRAFIGTISRTALKGQIRRIFSRSVKSINAHPDRYNMIFWEGPPEGRAERFILRELPRRAKRVEARLGDDIELLAYEIRPRRIRPEDTVKISLYFRAKRTLRRDWTVFVHGDRPNRSRRRRMVNDHAPADGLIPTSEWPTDAIVRDESDLQATRGQQAGTYTVFVGLFDDDGRLPVKAGPTEGDNRVKLGTYEVER